MSSVFSGTNQGSFTSTGTSTLLKIRSDVDWINVYNTTQMATGQTTAVGVQYYWQRGFPAGAMIAYFKSNAANASNLTQYLTSGGFTLIDTTVNTPGPLVALTSISGATPPVVATANTAGLSNGDIVRIFNVAGAQQLGGLDFTIGAVTTNTSFTLAYMQAIVAGTTGNFRRIPYSPYFYPPTRVISRITPGPSANTPLPSSQTVVTFTVTHAFTIGQSIRFVIPTVTALAYGMTQLNGVQATIVGINQADSVAPLTGVPYNTITVNVDTTAFGTFAWPLTADPVHTPAQVVPVGENTAQALFGGSIGAVGAANSYTSTVVGAQDILGDSEINQGFIGISLTGGAGSPGGAANDIIYWVAGKSFSGGA